MAANDFLINLSVLYRNMQKYFDKALAAYDIGSGQVQFLFFINENEGITMQEMSKIGEVDKGTTSKSIQRLIDQGFVQTKIDENDHRIKRLYTTAKAGVVMPLLYEYRNQLRAKMGSALDMDTFERLLGQIAANSRQQMTLTENYRGLLIGGLQKMSLSDDPGNVCATIYMAGCCYKCPYCGNKDLVFIPENYHFLDPNQVMDYLRDRKGFLDSVCISGGEPLMQDGLAQYLRDIRAMGYRIVLQTCGERYENLQELLTEGLVDEVWIDIKNVPEKYAVTAGMNPEDYDDGNVKASLQLLNHSQIPYTCVTTVVKDYHTEGDLVELAGQLKDCPKWVLRPFKDSDYVIQSGLSGYSSEELTALLKKLKTIHPNVMLAEN